MSNHLLNTLQDEDTQGHANLEKAQAVYLDVWNMECPECANWLHDGLLKVSGVLVADVFYKQGIAVVIYDPARVTTDSLRVAVGKIGVEESHFYGAEVIGQSSAQDALHR